MPDAIKSYTNASFRATYVQPAPEVEAWLKLDYGQFFLLRLEEVVRVLKLPVPPSRSANHALVFLLAGEATLQVGAASYLLGPRDCLFVPAGQAFAVADVPGAAIKGYLCNFHPDFLAGLPAPAAYEFLQAWGIPLVRLDAPTADYVAHLLARLRLHYTTQGVAARTLWQATLGALLSEVQHAYQPPYASAPTAAVGLTQQFQQLLSTPGQHQRAVADYAQQLRVTPNHLNKVVRLVTGKSPGKWLAEALVLDAKVLLAQTTLPVGEVAAQVGLLDGSYFSRFFKKHTALTPAAFRKLIEKS